MFKFILLILTPLILILNTGCADNITEEPESFNSDKPIFEANVIYGEDDRKDWFEVLDENIKTAARSTLGIFNDRSLNITQEFTQIDTSPSGFCETEKFHQQRKGPFCSGFLVGPDLVLTAGHCISSNNECLGLKFVFDYALTSPLHDPTQVPSENVYSCKNLIAREFTRRNADWALVRLDRPVLDRAPLKIRREGEAPISTPLTLVGHPSGLPSKIARGGQVHKIEQNHIVADLDSFKGNSGSAVFNSETLEVEGILVRGRKDYHRENGCVKNNICAEGIGTSCRFPSSSRIEGEHVSKITDLLDLIPPLLIDEDTEEDQEDPAEGRSVFSNKKVLPIPDNFYKTVSSQIKNVSELSTKNIENLKVYIALEHTYISDLSVKLTAPNGKSIYLHKNTGKGVSNISGVYGEKLRPHQSFDSLGPQPEGDWSLEIKDHVPYDKGQLIAWGIQI